jgi:hypothetical protein
MLEVSLSPLVVIHHVRKGIDKMLDFWVLVQIRSETQWKFRPWCSETATRRFLSATLNPFIHPTTTRV